MSHVSTKGHTCVICKGEYEFPSNEARGLYPDPTLAPDVFICWECIHHLFIVFAKQISNKSYTFLFVKRERALGAEKC